MPGGERDDGLSPVCHPTPHPPAVASSPTDKKDQRHFRNKTWMGEGMDCRRALYQNAAYLSPLRWQIGEGMYCNIFWGGTGSCFDYMKPTELYYERSQASFSSSSSHLRTNMVTQTEKLCAALGCWTFLDQPIWDLTWSFLHFRIQETKYSVYKSWNL